LSSHRSIRDSPRDAVQAVAVDTFVEGFESVSDTGNRAEMQRRGYTAEEIAKGFGGNWMRAFAALGIRKVPGYRRTSLSEKAWSGRRPIL
jgi:hypothetical protein